MFFGKRKKKENENTFIRNKDALPIIDTEEKVFLRDFTPDQEQVILYGLDRGYPIRVYGYTQLPASYMKLIVDSIYESPKGHAEVREIDIWKLVHTDLNYNQMKWCLQALTYGLSIVDHIPDLKQYDDHVLELIAEGAVYGINLCNEVSPDMYIEVFTAKANDKITQAMNKEKNKNILNKFIYGK